MTCFGGAAIGMALYVYEFMTKSIITDYRIEIV